MKDLLSLPSFSVRTVAALFAVAAFWMAVVGQFVGHSPLQETEVLLRWLGIDAVWPDRVSTWIDDRSEAATALSGLCVMGGIATVMVVEPKLSVGNVPGAWTALASTAVLLQVGAGVVGVLGWVVGGCIAGLIAALLARRSVAECAKAGAAELFASAIAPVLLLGYLFVA